MKLGAWDKHMTCMLHNIKSLSPWVHIDEESAWCWKGNKVVMYLSDWHSFCETPAICQGLYLCIIRFTSMCLCLTCNLDLIYLDLENICFMLWKELTQSCFCFYRENSRSRLTITNQVCLSVSQKCHISYHQIVLYFNRRIQQTS